MMTWPKFAREPSIKTNKEAILALKEVQKFFESQGQYDPCIGSAVDNMASFQAESVTLHEYFHSCKLLKMSTFSHDKLFRHIAQKPLREAHLSTKAKRAAPSGGCSSVLSAGKTLANY